MSAASSSSESPHGLFLWGAVTEIDKQAIKINDTSKVLRFPVRLPSLPIAGPITGLSVGQKHLLVVIGGTVYGYGNNAHAQLGKTLPAVVDTLRPVGFTSQSPVAEVVCGLKHSMIRTADGNVYTSGDNEFKQLGHTTRAAGWNPIRLAHVTQIASGGNTCYAVTQRGEVYSWGSQREGSLGHGTRGMKERMKAGKDEFEDVPVPKVIEWFVNKRVKVIEISASKDHFVARSDSDVYVCGEGNYGKLGQGDVDEQLDPVRLTLPERKQVEKIVGIAAGGDSTLVVRESTEMGSIIYACGRWGSGSSDNSYLRPEIFTFPNVGRIASIQAGPGHAYVIDKEGACFAWGNITPTACVGTSATAKRTTAEPIMGFDGKVVTRIVSSQFLVAAICDDTAADATVPREAVVPFRGRTSDMSSRMGRSYDYDEARRFFLSRLLGGEDTADAYLAGIPQPEPEPEVVSSYKKVGTKRLNIGSKVRLWMTDVYALGKITTKNLEGHSEKEFEVTWERDDWDPEILELVSDDETLNEENPNRWQKCWFLAEEIEGDL